MMMSFPPSLNISKKEMERKMEDAFEKGGDPGNSENAPEDSGDVERLEKENFNVRGVPTPVDRAVMTHRKTGKRIMRYSLVVETEGGRKVIIMFMGPEEGFDREGVQTFLSGIR